MKSLTNILMGLLLIMLMIAMFLPFTNDTLFALLGETGVYVWCITIFVMFPIISSYHTNKGEQHSL
jgi:hypothetical protein